MNGPRPRMSKIAAGNQLEAIEFTRSHEAIPTRRLLRAAHAFYGVRGKQTLFFTRDRQHGAQQVHLAQHAAWRHLIQTQAAPVGEVAGPKVA